MHPPVAACQALARLHPHLRLAWEGRAPEYKGEINPGNFAIVQLYHWSDCGDLEDPLTFREFWDLTTAQNDAGGFYRKRQDRGPIFAADGSTKRDWASGDRYPVFVATLDKNYQGFDGWPMGLDDVFSGRFILTVRQWLTPIEDRIATARKQKGYAFAAAAEQISGEMTDELMFEANKTSETGVRMAKKHIKEQDGSLREYLDKKKGRLKDRFFMPPPPKKGRVQH